MNNFNLFISPKAKKYLAKKINSEQSLFIELKKSGCSGYSINFNVINTNEAKDLTSYVFNGVNILIAEDDTTKMQDTLIDLREEGLNQKIVFENPKAIHHCGCGESFALKG